MIRIILDFTRGFRGRIALSASMGILRVVAGLIFVVLSKRAVDVATGNGEGNLTVCIAGLVGALVTELLLSAIVTRTTELSESGMKNSLQERLFGLLLRAKWIGKERFHSGDSLSRLTEDCRVASESLCRTIPAILIAIFQLGGAFLFLWYFSPMLAIILILVIPLFLLAGKVFFRRMRKLTKEIRDVESNLHEEMQESLYHRILLMAYRDTARKIEQIKRLHAYRLSLIRKRIDFTLYSRTVVFIGFETGYLVAFIWGIMGLSMKTITFGTMTAYLQLCGQIQRPLAELARLLPGLVQSHTAFVRIAEIVEIPIENAEERIHLSERVEQPKGLLFENVTFGYPDGGIIFKHFSHTFPPGSKTAIFGETGLGKTTLLLLALAIIKPQEGRIEVFSKEGEEKNSEEVSSATRGLFVYVPQGNSLISGSIRSNLQLGRPDATEGEMSEALHDAAADFVFSLKDGLDTICGEHGDGLSEGEAQRIAIARGLLQRGTILLLDEISASLDEETEKILFERLLTKRRAHTIIFVTHRSAVTPYCDYVLPLK